MSGQEADTEDSAAFFTRLATSTEPLHPDLVPWLGEVEGVGWRALRHPLVMSVPYTGAGIPNWAYEQKRKTEQEYVDQGKWRALVWLYERPYRFWKFAEVCDEMTDQDYWETLSMIWVDSENIHQNLTEWHDALTSDRPGREQWFMDEGEREDYERLPETVTVYRGCRIGLNEDGLSWTTDKAKAVWFAKRFGDDDAPPAVRTATVRKQDIVAMFCGRGESEVVIRDFDAVTETSLEIL